METTNTTRRQTKTTVTARKRIVFRVAAIGIGLSVVLLAELLLRAFNVGSPQRIQDPLVGFSQVHSLFERDGDRERC